MVELTGNDVREQVALIERMMLEGRRTTEYWGWSFVLWGVAYLVAIGWSYAARNGSIAWPVTMIAATVVTIGVAGARRRKKPATTLGRSVGAIWAGVGISLFVYCFSAALSGHLEAHSFVAAIEAFLGAASFASGVALRWKLQQAVGGMWWAAAVATLFVGEAPVLIILVGAVFLGNVCFGVYLMVREARDKSRAGQVLHA
jgi:hypothetical protein